tara:strand:+ start:61 stop:756 length:696 start_codon:yes stop_codon:yes gene_type:complete
LDSIRDVVDELLIVDSGSTDKTKEIANQFNVRFLFRKLDNFSNQRMFAVQNCEYDWVLWLDSDVIPDSDFVQSIAYLKKKKFVVDGREPDVFTGQRKWIAFGKNIHSFYPSISPDYCSCLHKKEVKIEGLVHEKIVGISSHEMIEGCLNHYTCDSMSELYTKLNLFTSLSAKDAIMEGKKGSWLKVLFRPVGVFLKVYFLHGAWKDGFVGLILARYAFQYSYLTHIKVKLG